MPFFKWRLGKKQNDGKEKEKKSRRRDRYEQQTDQQPNQTEQPTVSDDDTIMVYLASGPPKDTIVEVLRSLNNNEIQIAQTEDECVDLITPLSDKKVLLILDTPPSESILESIKSLSQVDSVIVYSKSFDKQGNELTPEQTSREILRCENPDNLVNIIQTARNEIAKQTAAFSVYNQKDKATRDLSKESASFLFFQLLKTVILNMPKTQEAKQMMVSKCKEFYRGNLVELANINEFDMTYKPDEAIQWYTKECFLYRFINKALRTEDVNILYHFRFYIVDLCKQLELKFEDLKARGKNLVKLYRGSCLSPAEVENFQKSIGNLIATNGYLSTSYDRSVAYGFATKPNNRVGVVRALFEYQVDITQVKHIVIADIAQYSAFPEEAEMLVDIGASFRIESCTYDPADNLYHVQVQATDQGAALAAEYIEYQKKKMMDANIVLLFGHLLLEMGEYEKANQYFDNILNSSKPNDEEIACIYFNFGRTHRLRDNLEEAFHAYLRAYNLHAHAKPKRLASAAKALNGIGIVFSAMGRDDDALQCFVNALGLFKKSVRKKHVDVAGTLINLSTIQCDRKQYDEALVNTLKAQKLFQDCLPGAHPNHASTFATLGNIYFGLGRLDLSIENYKRALEIQLLSLPSGHPDITRTLHNIGLAYERRGDYKVAHDYVQKALETVPNQEKQKNGHLLALAVDRGKDHVLASAMNCPTFRF
ncbi:unnamed protein product [Adineta ricciae]|uniref:ADP ribosyltransferase domain-containing protein n=1 Tax=Adineta ricciae TaxID=249248 RepID=A0A814W7B9_ADIRI|nr:unnamed protein product [Adineta ricciae]CAF1194884.1 unnamed protein product [Adineta ricciae]